MTRTSARQFWVVVHRWAGLTIALFTFVVGLTGSILPWQTPLQRVLAPERFVSPPMSTTPRMSWSDLRRIAERRTGGVVSYMLLRGNPGEAAVLSIAAPAGKPPLTFDEIVLNPYDGHEIERARSGNLADGKAQLIPFLYLVHQSLALGDWGSWALGVAALIWTFDCFVGFYLSLPPMRRRWGRQFAKAWTVRWRASGYRLNFDLHRAGGLWLWPLLLVFAWSSVGMNLRPVFDPVMAATTDYHAEPASGDPRPSARATMSWEQALPLARRLSAAEAARRGLHVAWERAMFYDPANNVYSYAVRTERDRSDDGANSYFNIDAATGRLVHVNLPTGEHAGNTIDYWLGQLHVAGVFGIPYRVLVTFLGLAITVISVTGVVIWMRKRAARLLKPRSNAFSSLKAVAVEL